MNLQREPIYAALFALIQANTTYSPQVEQPSQPAAQVPFTTYSRRLRIFDSVDLSEMPYCCLTTGNEEHETKLPGMRDLIRIKPQIFIYLPTPDPTVPGTIWNPIMDQLQSLFPSATQDPQLGKQTLNGLVQHVIIKGEVKVFEGTLDNKLVGIVPLEILVFS